METHQQRSFEKLITGASHAFLFGIIGYIIMFIFRVVLVRFLGSDGYGVYALGETILKVAMVVVSAGIVHGISTYIPEYLYKKQNSLLAGYLRFIYFIPFIFSVVVAVILFIFASQITTFFGFPEQLIKFIQLISFIIPVKILVAVTKKIFISKKKIIYREISYNIIENGLLLVTGILVILLNLPPYYLFVGILVASCISLLFLLANFKKVIHFPKLHKRSYDFKIWLYFSLPLFFNEVFGYFVSWSDNLFISKLMTAESLGIYAATFSLATLLLFFQKTFSTIFMPLISEAKALKQEKLLQLLFNRSASWVSVLTLPITLLLLFYPSNILMILFGSEYVAGATSLMILSIGISISVFMGLSSSILILNKNTLFIFKANIITVLLNFVLNYFLIKSYGILGAAIATAFSMALVQIVFFFRARKHEKISLDFFYLLKFMVLGLVAITLSTFLPILFQNIVLETIYRAISFGLLFIVGLILIKPFKSEDKDLIDLVNKKIPLNISWLKKFM